MTGKELWGSILQKAMEGKLVPQRKEEGTAAELLKEIRKEKAKLVKEGKLKKTKPLPAVSEEEKPFDIPDSWEWVRLKELGNFSSGKTPSKQSPENWQNGTVNWFTSKDIKSDYLQKSQILITEQAAKELRLYTAGTLLMVVRSGILKRIFPLSFLIKPGTINQDIKAFEIYDNKISRYLFLCLKAFSPYILKEYRKRVTTVDSLKFDKFSAMPIPLPPLSEQHRIVEKLEKLKPLIDAYGQAVEELDELNRKFPGDLKKSLLQQAMEGKLVPQRKEEGTAAELLKEIRKERAKLVKEGKLKKTKPLPAVSEEEKPFDIPDSWEWVRLGDISINLDSERIPLSVSQRSKLEKIYDYYGASGVIDKVDNYLFDKPLLLIGEDGANLLTRSKPIAFIAKGKYWVNNHAHVLDFPVSIDKEYVMFYINSISLSAYVTGTAQPKMNQANMNTIPVPLPPSSEQHRIVKKLESLLALCDKLQPEN